MEFVEAARLRGEGLWWVMRREVLPNTVTPLIAEFGLRFSFAFLFIASLSFLGLGIQPPYADWGGMVRENSAAITYGIAAPLYPAAAIGVLTVGRQPFGRFYSGQAEPIGRGRVRGARTLSDYLLEMQALRIEARGGEGGINRIRQRYRPAIEAW